jgi:cytochrome c peroxidase
LFMAAGLVIAPAALVAEAAAPEKKPPRAERTASDRAEVVRQLREVYRRAPAAWPAPHVDPGIEWREIGLLPPVEHPESNPFNATKVELGRLLFFDRRLSADGKMACVSCHEPNLGWADGRPVSQPHGRSPDRNTPTIRNVAFQKNLFWDGRAGSLEQQVEDALTNPEEMAADRNDVVRMLGSSPGYRKLFDEAFSGRPITFAAVVEAVACFERTIVSGRSRFDRFVLGDEAALSDDEILGLDLFRREARCMNCHHGPTFSDGRFHDLGLSFYGRSNEDLGRHAVLARRDTHHAADAHRDVRAQRCSQYVQRRHGHAETAAIPARRSALSGEVAAPQTAGAQPSGSRRPRRVFGRARGAASAGVPAGVAGD